VRPSPLWAVWLALVGLAVALVHLEEAAATKAPVRLVVLNEDAGELPQRPRTRGECAHVPRPCPFVSCRYSLFLEVGRTGPLRLNHGDGVDPGDVPPDESCALDVAERGECSQEEIAELMGGMTVEWIRQVERSAEAELRFNGGPALLAVLHESGPVGGAPVSHVEELELRAQDGHSPPRAPADLEALEEVALDRWTGNAAALVAAGLPLRAAWSIANAIESGTFGEDDVAGDEREGEHEQLVDELDDQEVTMQAERVRTNGAAGKVRTTASTETPVGAATVRAGLRARLLDELAKGPVSAAELGERTGEELRRVRSALSALRERREVSCDGAGVRARWYLGATAPSSPAPTRAKKRARRTSVDRELAIALLGADTAKLELVERLLTRLGGQRGR
jgi:DNA-binding transcriptional ArsR family regulator